MTVPGVYSPEQVQAHVDKVISSDGVDDSRAVEVMARAIAVYVQDKPEAYWVWLGEARAAMGALRALEGE